MTSGLERIRRLLFTRSSPLHASGFANQLLRRPIRLANRVAMISRTSEIRVRKSYPTVWTIAQDVPQRRLGVHAGTLVVSTVGESGLMVALVPASVHRRIRVHSYSLRSTHWLLGAKSLLVDRPVLHHQLHRANRRDVFSRVALHRDQIGQIALLHLPELLAHAQHLRVDRRRRAERGHRRHPVSHQHLELPRVVTMSEYADVAAVADRHAGVEGSLEAFLLGDDGRRIRIDALPPAVVLHDRIAGGERR